MPGTGTSRFISINAGVDDETLGVPFDASRYPYVCFFVKGTGTTSSGVVTIEEADWEEKTDTPYSGTWSSITTVNASDVTGGAQKAIHLQASQFHWIRPRISTVIGGGGSITVVIEASGAS